jgi:alpha-galactosidase
MAIPEACAFAESVVERMINEYKIDVFRLDRNAEIHFTNRYGEREKCRYFENLYAMFRRLREKYPSVIFENCASGGGRTDLGMVANFTHTWVSDHQIAPRAMQITNGMTMVLPPERVDRLASGMSSHTTASLDLVVRHTLFGRPTTNDYNAVGTEANPNQLAFVRHCYDIYKEIIRPFAPTGRIYHHTPELYDYETKGTMILERAARDRSAGVIGIFRLVGTNGDETTVRPRGIDLGATYAVTFDNTGAVVTLSGFEMQRGLSVRIGQNLSSELIIYRKLDT